MEKMMKKLIIAVVALSLMLVGVVGGVIAWLTAESATVTNTFTAGKIEIELNETGTGEYKFVPGQEYTKDPRVTVKAESEDCYVYVMVTNNLALRIEDQMTEVVTYQVDTSWRLVDTFVSDDNIITYLYCYNDIVEYSDDDQQLPCVFKEGKIVCNGQSVTMENIGDLAGKTMVIKAYAHQVLGIEGGEADETAIEWAEAVLAATPSNP